MTTEEKLQHFLDFCMEDARTRSAKMLDEFTAAQEKIYDEHVAETKNRAEMHLEMESEKIEREINKRLAIEQINIKRTLGQKQDELKDMLFVELKNLLADFMETANYEPLLEKQIKEALAFAGDEELIIYMDPLDEVKSRRLSLTFNTVIRISEYSFFGGIRAVIPSKNILIDHSFQTKLEEARHEYRFDMSLGGNTNV